MNSVQLLLPDFQPIREAIRTYTVDSAYAVSGPSAANTMSNTRTYVYIQTYVDFIFSSLGCTMCVSCYDMCSVTPLFVQDRGHRRQSVCLTPCRGGLRFGTTNHIIRLRARQAVPRGSSRDFKAGKGGEAPEQLLLAPPPWRN